MRLNILKLALLSDDFIAQMTTGISFIGVIHYNYYLNFSFPKILIDSYHVLGYIHGAKFNVTLCN